MKQTPNYNLPQFEGLDKFTKEDFNDAFSKIDLGISDIQETINSSNGDTMVIAQEIIEARKGETSLKTRIDKIDEISKINKIELEGKIGIELLNSEVSNLNNSINANVLSLNNSINERKAEITTLNNSVNERKIEIDFLNDAVDETFYIGDSGYLYEPSDLVLDPTWVSFYSTSAIPKVSMTNDGQLKFTGNAKIVTQGTYNAHTDGTIKVATITSIPIADKEGVPLRGQITCCKANGGMKIIPIILQSDGTLCIPNTGGADDEYYARLDFSSLTINTMNFGENNVRNKVDSVITSSLSRNFDFQALFFTDLHFDLSKISSHSRNLKYMNYIDNVLDLDCIISGGDNILEPYNNIPSSKLKQSIQSHKTVYNSFRPNKFVYCNGNHDGNFLQGNASTLVFPNHIKKYFNNKNVVWAGTDKYYGYVDFPSSKTRVVVFDTLEDDGVIHNSSPRVTAQQINWICKNALDMTNKSNWKVLFIGHILPLDDETIVSHLIPTRVAIRNVIRAFKNGIDTEVIEGDLIRFSRQGSQTVVGWLGGHNHKDTLTVVDEVSYVSTLLAWSTNVTGSPRALGHSWELCFELISIVPSERKMYLDRIGRGSSRVISY